jgi:hypothetical protein
LFIPKIGAHLYGIWQGRIFPGGDIVALPSRDLCEYGLPGHPAGAAQSKNLISTRKYEILRFAQDDKMAFRRFLKLHSGIAFGLTRLIFKSTRQRSAEKPEREKIFGDTRLSSPAREPRLRSYPGAHGASAFPAWRHLSPRLGERMARKRFPRGAKHDMILSGKETGGGSLAGCEKIGNHSKRERDCNDPGFSTGYQV